MRATRSLSVDRRTGTRGFLTAVASVCGLAILAGLLAFGVDGAASGHLTDICVVALLYACVAVGLQTFVGSTGIVSFGHLGFVALGAYAAGIVSVPPERKRLLLPDLPGFLAAAHLDYPLSLIVAMVVPAALAAIVGPALMRLSGQAAAVTSFAFLVIVNDALRNAKSVTNGARTFSGVPLQTTLLHAAVALVVAVLLASLYKWSSMGLWSRATRDDELAASSAGIAVLHARMRPWTVSAAICGLAGGLWAHYLTAFSPVTFYMQPTIIVIVMLFVGGAMSLSGAIAGAVVVSVWMELARRIDGGLSIFGVQLPAVNQFSDLSLAVALVILLQVAPDGIFGHREVQLRTGSQAHAPKPLSRREETS